MALKLTGEVWEIELLDAPVLTHNGTLACAGVSGSPARVVGSARHALTCGQPRRALNRIRCSGFDDDTSGHRRLAQTDASSRAATEPWRRPSSTTSVSRSR